MAIAPALASAAVEVAVDFAVGALKAAAEEQTTQAVAAYPANGWFYEQTATGNLVVARQSACVQIISGSFWNGLQLVSPLESENSAVVVDSRETVDVGPRVLDRSVDENGATTRVIRNKIEDTEMKAALNARFRQLRHARFFFEATIKKIDGSKSLFSIAPQGLYFEKQVERTWFEFSDRPRNLVISLSLIKGGSDPTKPFASVTFPFRSVPVGTFLTPLYFAGLESRSLAAPDLDGDEKEAAEAVQAALKQAASDYRLVTAYFADRDR